MKRILTIIITLTCAVGCNSAFLDPDYYERTSESTTELFYNEDTKLTMWRAQFFAPSYPNHPSLVREKLDDCDSTCLSIHTGYVVHPHHSDCKHESSISTRFSIHLTLPGDISLEDCVERIAERDIPFTNIKSRGEDYSIVGSEFDRDKTYLFSEGWICFLQHDKEDEYYEMKIEYKNVYEDHVDSFTKGRIKINVHDFRP